MYELGEDKIKKREEATQVGIVIIFASLLRSKEKLPPFGFFFKNLNDSIVYNIIERNISWDNNGERTRERK